MITGNGAVPLVGYSIAISTSLLRTGSCSVAEGIGSTADGVASARYVATCGFLVATRGERGPCNRTEGCEPDLATVRTDEMQKAAAVFAGEVTFADCRDMSASDSEEVLRIWEVESNATQRFADAI